MNTKMKICRKRVAIMRKKYFKAMLAVFFLVLCTLGTTGCSSKESEDSGGIGKGKLWEKENFSF